MTRLEFAIERIRQAREYTLPMLEGIGPDDWFRQPAEGVTHLAWQVGHIAMAQYRLALERLRGERPEDAAIISPEQIVVWFKGSTPDPDPAKNPTPDETLQVFHRVYDQVMKELPTFTEAQLDETIVKPHRLFTQKYDSLIWCSQHEFIHAGQIGLVRRLLGRAPLW
jgi:uncharacterized damage-inducible protein DinB